MATEPDKVNTGVLGTMVVVGAFAMVVVSLVVTALVRTESEAWAGQREGARFATSIKEQQREQLASPPAWAEKEKGLVAIPIDRAMNLVTEELKKNPALATPVRPNDEDAGSMDSADAGAPEMNGDGAETGERETEGDSPEQQEQEAPPEKEGDTPVANQPGSRQPTPKPGQGAPSPGSVAPKAPGPAAPKPQAPKPQPGSKPAPAPAPQSPPASGGKPAPAPPAGAQAP